MDLPYCVLQQGMGNRKLREKTVLFKPLKGACTSLNIGSIGDMITLCSFKRT